VFISPYTIVVHNTAQNSSDNLPSYPPDIIVAQMMSTAEKGDTVIINQAEYAGQDLV